MGAEAPTSFGAIYAALNRLRPGEEMVYYSGPVPKDDDVRRMFGAAYMLYEAGTHTLVQRKTGIFMGVVLGGVGSVNINTFDYIARRK